MPDFTILKKFILGTGCDRMPDPVFRLMIILYKIYYFFKPPEKYLEKFGIQPGFTVVDYGCGPGAFIKAASEKTGDKGRVYAIDIQALAISAVKKIIDRHNLKNVIPVLSRVIKSEIPAGTADLIYALDMFHMVKDHSGFLKELKRISKPDASLILEDGHQSRKLTKQKILGSGAWEIVEEQKRFLRCKPL